MTEYLFKNTFFTSHDRIGQRRKCGCSVFSMVLRFWWTKEFSFCQTYCWCIYTFEVSQWCSHEYTVEHSSSKSVTFGWARVYPGSNQEYSVLLHKRSHNFFTWLPFDIFRWQKDNIVTLSQYSLTRLLECIPNPPESITVQLLNGTFFGLWQNWDVGPHV